MISKTTTALSLLLAGLATSASAGLPATYNNSMLTPYLSGTTLAWYYNPAEQLTTITTAQATTALQASARRFEVGCGVALPYQGILAKSTYGYPKAGEYVVFDWISKDGSAYQYGKLPGTSAEYRFLVNVGYDEIDQAYGLGYSDPMYTHLGLYSAWADMRMGQVLYVYGDTLPFSLERWYGGGKVATRLFKTAVDPSYYAFETCAKAGYRAKTLGKSLYQGLYSATALAEATGRQHGLDAVVIGKPSPGVASGFAWQQSVLAHPQLLTAATAATANAKQVALGLPTRGFAPAYDSLTRLKLYHSYGVTGGATSSMTWFTAGTTLAAGAPIAQLVGATTTSLAQGYFQSWVAEQRIGVIPARDDDDNLSDFASVQQVLPLPANLTQATASALVTTPVTGHVYGTRQYTNLSAEFTLGATDTKTYNVYVVANVGGTFFSKAPNGSWMPWTGGEFGVYFTVTAPAVVAYSILPGLDTRGLPDGTVIYTGYGRTLLDMVAKGTYAIAYTFDASTRE